MLVQTSQGQSGSAHVVVLGNEKGGSGKGLPLIEAEFFSNAKPAAAFSMRDLAQVFDHEPRCRIRLAIRRSNRIGLSRRPAHRYCAAMDWPDYLRDQAAKYRQLADQTDDPVIKNEMLELASVCIEVANNIEDHLTGG